MRFLYNDYSHYVNQILKFNLPYINYTRDVCSDRYTTEIVFSDSVIDKINSSQRVIVDLSLDPWNAAVIKKQFDVIDPTQKIIYLTGVKNQQDSTSNILYFPSWLYLTSSRFKNAHRTNLTSKRSTNVSCLNRHPAAHKVYIYYKLLNYYDIDHMMVSFNGLKNYYNNTTLTLDDDLYCQIPADIKEKLRHINFYKEAFVGDINKVRNDHSTTHPAFTDCYMNLVTESSFIEQFYTEKTYKPLVAGQLFLQVGAKNNISGLKDLGFECFDDDFFGHYYDSEDYFITRIDKLIQLLTDVYSDIEHIYFKNIEKMEFNREYFLSENFRQKLLSPLKEFDLI